MSAAQQFLGLPPPALSTDTPSRHPCKISVRTSEKRRFQYNPYKGLRAPTLAQEREDDDSDIDDDAISAALREEEALMHGRQEGQLSAPMMVPIPLPVGTMPVSAGAPASFMGPSLGGVTTFAPSAAGPSTCVSSTGACLVNDGNGCMRMVPGTIAYANVRFKFSEATFYVPCPERAGLAIGDLIVVQGDRGEDIGAVTGDATAIYGVDPIPGKAHVLRRALNKDRKRYFAARRKETYAAGIATDLAKELQLNMVVLDCEFQADLQKLTVFYRPTVEGLIDFRQLQRSLFKHFRCRIWLLNWDSEFQQILEQHRRTVVGRHPHIQQGSTVGVSIPLPISVSW
jgi:hypothetical protein